MKSRKKHFKAILTLLLLIIPSLTYFSPTSRAYSWELYARITKIAYPPVFSYESYNSSNVYYNWTGVRFDVNYQIWNAYSYNLTVESPCTSLIEHQYEYDLQNKSINLDDGGATYGCMITKFTILLGLTNKTTSFRLYFHDLTLDSLPFGIYGFNARLNGGKRSFGVTLDVTSGGVSISYSTLSNWGQILYDKIESTSTENVSTLQITWTMACLFFLIIPKVITFRKRRKV